MRTSLRATYAVVAGCLLFQAAWILALQPFRGMDEWDHVYRAGSVAEGYWHVSEMQPGSRHGQLIPVPRDLVDAATPVCEDYSYVAPDNCRPQRRVSSELVTVSSGAAYYNPLFYAVIGMAAAEFEGADALYVMRMSAAVLCAALIGLGAWGAASWSQTPWPLLGILICLTPTVLYSTAVPAPNGLEMAAALTAWVCLLGLARATRARPLLVLLAISASLLAVLRALGPLWLACILLASIAITPRSVLGDLWRRQRTTVVLVAITVSAAVLGGSGYSALARTNAHLVAGPDAGPSWSALGGQVVVWLYQAIGAFPNRSQPAPTVVYALVLLVWVGVLAAGWRVQTVRERLAAVFVALAALAVGGVVTTFTFSANAFTWQGRYALPLVVGIVLVAAGALDRAGTGAQGRRWVVVSAVAALGGAQTVSVLAVSGYLTQLNHPPDDPSWLTVPGWALAGLCLVGTGCWWRAVALTDASRPNEAPGRRATSNGSESANLGLG